MNIYFDTEFTGLVPNTTLISLGCVAETGEKFYAEFTDYNKELCDDWIKENVIKNLSYKMVEVYDKDGLFQSYSYEYNDFHHLLMNDSSCSYYLGTADYIRDSFTKWLAQLHEKHGQRIQFVSDVCHYDFYLLCNLFGGAFSLPEYVNPVCYDICQDICPREVKDGEFLWYADMDDMYTAFDISREEVCKKVSGKLPEGKKHNSLYDAEVIKMIYEGMRK